MIFQRYLGSKLMFSAPLKTSSNFPHKLSRASGFTLVELMVVIFVILVLAGITFGISRGVQNAQARAKVKAELAVIAQSLEQFKSTYGDYPRIETTSEEGNADDLLRALSGYQILERNTAGVIVMRDVGTARKSFLNPDKVRTSRTVPADSEPTTQYFIDPWGNPYVYIYNRTDGGGGSWDNFGYVLFSSGPDGSENVDGVDTDGLMDTVFLGHAENLDNIYVGE